MQCTDAEIASFFHVSARTIERRRSNAKIPRSNGQRRAKGKISVRRMLFRLGNNGNVAAAIFLAKNLLGYRDVVNNQLSGPDGGEIHVRLPAGLLSTQR